MSAFGSAMFTSPTAAKDAKTPPVVGSLRTEERHAGGAQPLERGERLRELHEGERPLLHPRAAGRGDDDERDAARARALGRARDLLPDDRPHRAAHEPEVHDAEGDIRPPMSAVPHTAASRMPVAV
jgi:hypothetical protein